MTDFEKFHSYFNNPDYGFFPEIKNWITEDLKKQVEDVRRIQIDQPAYEVISDTTWKKFAPGYLMHFILTFADGTQHVKTFEYDTEQEKWRPM